MRIPGYIMDGISAYIIFMEFMSVMENCKKMGVPIPGFVSKALNTIDEALKEEDVAEAVKKVAELEKEVEELKKLSSD
jgi:phage-related holin